MRFLQNKTLLGTLCTLLMYWSAEGQVRIGYGGGRSSSGRGLELNYNEPKEFEIADLTVSGAKFYDAPSMLSVAGLKVGDKIRIPGEGISSAVKKLMDQGILEDVIVEATKTEGSKVWINVRIKERPRLYRIAYRGIRKGEQESLKEKVEKGNKGRLLTETLMKNMKLAIERFFYEKGYLNIAVKPVPRVDSTRGNNATLEFFIKKNNKVKIDTMILVGQSKLPAGKVFGAMKNTKARATSGIFSSSKFVPKKFDEDKIKLIEAYNKAGFRDARLLSDSIVKLNNGNLALVLNLEEGNRFHYRNITWEGNYIYPDSILTEVLGLKKGDVYNAEDLEKRLSGNPGADVSSLYMDDGYLFYSTQPQEVAVEGDSIDLVMMVHEGKQATINKVTLSGNTKTSDHVVLREIRTLPGQKFSKSAIIRTVRELSTLGYFNPEKINPVPSPRADGTVDIEYNVEEKPSDQIELSGGWGGLIGFVGTLGVVFNNFSIRNAGKASAWRPLPSGDGQKLAVRFQANGAQFQNYSLSFTEPWLGGRKPNSFTISLNHSVYNTIGQNTLASFNQGGGNSAFLNNPWLQGGLGGGFGGGGLGGFNAAGFGGFGVRYDPSDTTNGRFNTTSLTFSLGKRLKWPDDFFTMSVAFSAQLYDIARFQTGFYPEGKSTNFSLITSISRNSIDNPTFPRSGSSFSLAATFTPPYSLFRDPNTERKTQNLLEYHKWMFDASWFTPLVGKLVFHARAHFGFLGRYNSRESFVPIERFVVGGSGLTGQTFAFGGVDLVGLRGYADRAITPPGNGVVFNKFVMEARYPVSLNPSATIFVLGFMEGGNNWARYEEFNPFQLYKAAGVGVRIFMPAFGMLGFDFGKAFDRVPGQPNDGQSSFTFTIGQQLR
jgi:outer membrane protein insertion porin family